MASRPPSAGLGCRVRAISARRGKGSVRAAAWRRGLLALVLLALGSVAAFAQAAGQPAAAPPAGAASPAAVAPPAAPAPQTEPPQAEPPQAEPPQTRPVLPAAPPAAPATRAGADRADIEALVQTLEDDKQRARLVAQLQAMLGARKAAPPERSDFGTRVATVLSDRIEEIGKGLVEVGTQLGRPDLFRTWLRNQVETPARRAFWTRVFATLAGVLAAAWLAGRITARLLAVPCRALEAQVYPTVLGRFGAACLRGLLDLVPIAAFAAAGLGVLALSGAPHGVRLIALTVLNAAILVQAVTAAARLVLAPLAPNLRLIQMRDEAAAYAFVWIRRFTAVVVYGDLTVDLSRMVRVSQAGHEALVKLIGLLVTAMLVVLVLQVRSQVAGFIRGPERTARLGTLRARLAAAWHVVAIILLTAAYFTWALAIRGGFSFVVRGLIGSALVVLAARLIVAVQRRMLDQLFRVSTAFRARYPTLDERAGRYMPIIGGLVTTAIVAIAVVLVLQIWNVDALGMVESRTGRVLLLGVLRILLIVALAVAVVEIIGLATARYLHAPGPDGTLRERSARARTLLPLLRNVLMILIGSVAAISVLGQLGLNVAPLIAGVGIFGLAIGFGAQSLVKDVITGAFILFEDTIAVGDVVQLGAHSGSVEALSLRSVRLRDLSGHVHTVPFGVIDAVINRTRGFAYSVADVGIAYREDPDEVARLLTAVVEEMRADPAFAPSILAPLDVLGVDKLADSAVVLRVRIRTLPQDQWKVGREFNRRTKKAFDANGIEIPFPTRTFYFGQAKDGSAPPVHVAMEADAAPAQPGAGDPDAAARPGGPDS